MQVSETPPAPDRKMPVSELEVCFSGETSHVTRMKATYPYKFLTTNISDGIYSVVFLLGFGGGAVAGDCQQLKVKLNENAILVLRTQGSTKIFKSVDGKFYSQHIVVELLKGSFLAFVPEPTTCFKESKYNQHQIYDLQETASLVLVDWYTSGRMSRGEAWLLDRLLTRLEIYICGEKILFENLDLHDTDGIASAAEKVGSASAFGCVVLVGPQTESIRARVGAIKQRQTFRQKRETIDLGRQRSESNKTIQAAKIVAPSDPLVSVSNLGGTATILRFAADSTEDAYILLAEILKPLSTGRLCDLPRPYMDRIHCLSTEELNSNDVINSDKSAYVLNGLSNIGKKRPIDSLEVASRPAPHPTHTTLGSAIIAMKKYDEIAANKILKAPDVSYVPPKTVQLK